MKYLFVSLGFIASTAFAAGMGHLPKGNVSFKTPKDGQTVTSPVKIEMQISGLKIRPAGQDPSDHKTGHHHLIIDGKAVPMGEVIPNDANHMHFGKGQTQTEITLPPGPHTLTLQFADGAHRSYGPAFSETIHVTVK